MRRFGTIIKRSGKYLGKYKKNGKAYYTSAFPTKKAAERELKIIQGKILSGEWETELPEKAQAETAIFEKVWEERLTRLKKAQTSPNSMRAYISAGQKYFLPLYAGMDLASFTHGDLRKLERRLDEQRVAPRTFNNILALLSGFLTYARKQGVEVPEIDFSAVRRKEKSVRERNALTAPQLDAVIAAIEPELQLAFALAGYCALRYGEVAALTKEDIDLENMTVSIDKAVKRAVGGALVLGSPKSAAGYRTIVIPEKISPILERHFSDFLSKDDSRLFYSPEGPGGFINDKVLRRRLERACVAAGVPRVVFHELRHTGLTLFAQAGATLAELMYRAGHSDAKTVMIYQHASLERDRELASRLG